VATTKNHTQCSREAKPNQLHCWQHISLVDVSNANTISGNLTRNSVASGAPASRDDLRSRSERSSVLSSTTLCGGTPRRSFVNDEPSELQLDGNHSSDDPSSGAPAPELTYNKIITYAKTRKLSLNGGTVNVRNRVMESIRRGRVHYVDIIGNFHKVSKDKLLQYGQEINGLIMGEGELQIERQVYDPNPKLMSRSALKLVRIVPIDCNVNLSSYCLPMYRQDPLTQEDLSEISDLQMIYADSNKRCYYLPSILSIWENSFTFYDTTSCRVVPSYPKDIHGGYMDPSTVILVYHTARARGMDLSPYPLLNLLVSNEGVMYDLYRFINQYEELVIYYDRLAKSYREDLGLWNRRDLLAYDLIRQLYTRHNIPFNGCRKYTNIKSGPGRNGTQIFYQAILVAFFISKNYGITFDVDDTGNPQELKWIYDRKNHDLFAKPLYQINTQGNQYVYDYQTFDLIRPFVSNPLPII
jgi:hypothetical protein